MLLLKEKSLLDRIHMAKQGTAGVEDLEAEYLLCLKELVFYGHYQRMFFPLYQLHELKNKEDFDPNELVEIVHTRLSNLAATARYWHFNFQNSEEQEEDVGIIAIDQSDNAKVYRNLAKEVQAIFLKRKDAAGPFAINATAVDYHGAIRNGCVRMVEDLLKKGNSPNDVFRGVSALSRAIKARSARLVYVLVSKGAILKRQGEQESYLITACRYSTSAIQRLLVRAGAPIDGRDQHGRTALHYAAGRADTVLTELLLKYGADIKEKDRQGHTWLYYACEQTFANKLQFLSATAKDIAAEHARVAEYVKYFAGSSGLKIQKPKSLLLHLVAEKGNLQLFDYLVGAGLDLQARDGAGQTPLMVAAKWNRLKIGEKYGDRIKSQAEPPAQVLFNFFNYMRQKQRVIFFSVDGKRPSDKLIDELTKQGHSVRKVAVEMAGSRLVGDLPNLNDGATGISGELFAISMLSKGKNFVEYAVYAYKNAHSLRWQARLVKRFGVWVVTKTVEGTGL